jgi:cell division protein FtsB
MHYRHRTSSRTHTSWIQKRWITPLLILFVIWGAFVVKNIFEKYLEVRRLEQQSDQELQQMQHKEADLQEKIGELSTDRGKEAEVRNRYRVARPGESLVIVVDDQQEHPPQEPSSGVTSSLTTFWLRLRSFIGI